MEITPKQEKTVLDKLHAKKVLEKIGYRTDTISQQGDNIRCFCPIHKEAIFRSLTVNVAQNTYKCGYTLCPGFRGDNLLDLYAKAKGLTREESLIYWARELGLEEEILSKVSEEEIPEITEPAVLSPGKIEMMIAQKLQSLDNDPENKDLRKQIAELYLKHGDIPNAVDHYTTLAMHHLSSGDYINAVEPLEQSLSLEPTNNRVKELLAQASIHTGNRARAIELWSTTAKNYVDTKQNQKAIELYSELINQDPLETKWRYELINLLIRMDRIADAVREMKILADYHVQRSQLDDAFSLFEKILELTPQDLEIKKRAISAAQRLNKPELIIPYELEMVDSLLTSGNVSGAIESLHQALGETPGNIPLRKKLVDVLLQTGSTEEAIHQLAALAQLYLEKDDHKNAAATYQQLVEFQPENLNLYEKLTGLYEKLGFQKEQMDIYSRIAALHLNQRAIEPAISALKHALEIDPGNTRTQSALASAYIREKSQTKATDVLIALAKRYQMDGDLDRARRSYDRILEFNPTAIPAHEGLIEIFKKLEKITDVVKHLCEIAEIYRQRQEFSTTLIYIRQALRLHTKETRPLAIQAKIYQQIESDARAIASYYRLSKELSNQQNLAEAVQAAQQALSINPNITKIREFVANLFIQMGLKGDALSELRNLAITYEKLNDLDKSLMVLEKARLLDPNNLSLLESLARLYEQKKLKSKAKTIYFDLGKALKEKGLLDDAIENYHRVINLEPTHEEAITDLANTYMEIGAVNEAIGQFKSLITIYRNQRMFGEAIELCRRILEVESSNVEIHRILVDMYLEVGEQKEAVTHLFILTDIYNQQNQDEQSMEIYQKIIQLSPDLLSVYPPYAELCYRVGQSQKAHELYKKHLDLCKDKGLDEDIATTYRRLVELDPRNLSYREHLSEQYLKLGHTLDCLMEYDVIAGLYLEDKKYDKVIDIYEKMKKIDPQNPEIERALKQATQLAKNSI